MKDRITFADYAHQAVRTARAHATTQDALINWTLGLSGEAGEFANKLKKGVYHQHGVSCAELADELGDILWYTAVLAHTLGVSLEDVARQNIQKLQKRYPEGFDAVRSQNREE